MSQNKVEFEARNIKPFSQWLKRFSSIDNSLLLEIDEENSGFIAKTYDESRSVVKFSKMGFNDAGMTVKTSGNKRIKVGLFNIQKVIKTIEHFNNNEFLFTFNYGELIGEETTYAGTNIVLKNQSLKITIDCTSLNIFKYISDELFNNTISRCEPICKFKLDKETIDKINSLCSLDSDNKTMEFKSEDKKIFACGKTFEFLLNKDEKNSDVSLHIHKDQFEKLDTDDYEIIIGEDRMVFSSKNSETITVISSIEKE